ncbi:bifunctional nuclease family protein [Flavobacteriaceae bacterium]|nr:bifunctional nuclease family protein [Flavobacteriaceae bacterium]
MSLVKLNIRGISYSQTQTGAYALVLSETDGERTLPIVIGAFEAQSIAIALENEITPPRPLTHDLFKTFADTYKIGIKEVIIHKLVDGVFHASMVCEKDGEETVLDARTSDAIALAIRFETPIFTYNTILEKAGIILKQEDFKETQHPSSDNIEDELDELLSTPISSEATNGLAKFSIKELEDKMEAAIEKEDYETAAKLRDELNNR